MIGCVQNNSWHQNSYSQVREQTDGKVASMVGQTCDHRYFAERVQPLKLYMHTSNSIEYMSSVIFALLATF